MTKVDVVITTYKREAPTVLRAISSVQSQTEKDISITVVDDNGEGSSYSELLGSSISRLGDERIQLVSNVRNLGSCRSRNKGATRGSAPLIAFLDDDDEWLPEKLENQIPLFRDGNIGLGFCGMRVVFDGKGRSEDRLPRNLTPDIHGFLNRGNPISTSSSIVRRSVFDSVGGFDPFMPALQDWDLWLRMMRETSCAGVKGPYVIYHVHDGERITSNPVKRYEGYRRFCEKNADLIEKDPSTRAWFDRALAQHERLVGKTGEAIGHLFRAIRARPFELDLNMRCIAKVILSYKSPV